ncbi:hypothetical protein BGZ54_007193 [Gamsiella multidivaricata]|nr:hypothetical protein BGZ54_007193 [Gamsiella multidivaricata]
MRDTEPASLIALIFQASMEMRGLPELIRETKGVPAHDLQTKEIHVDVKSLYINLMKIGLNDDTDPQVGKEPDEDESNGEESEIDESDNGESDNGGFEDDGSENGERGDDMDETFRFEAGFIKN